MTYSLQLPFRKTSTKHEQSNTLEQFLFPGLLTLIILSIIVLLITASVLAVQRRARTSAQNATAIDLQLEQVYSGLRDAESGQRGYIITGNPLYLESYTSGSREVPRLLSSLQKQITNPQQEKELSQVTSLSNEKLAELASTVALRRNDGFDAAVAIVDTNRGMNIMDEAHTDLGNMEKQITAQINEQDQTANRLAAFSYASIFVLFLVIVGVVYFIKQLFDQSKVHSKQIEIANAELIRSNRELQDFASVASHDLQEPLRKIQAFGDRLLSSTTLSPDSQQYLSRMLNASSRMRILIDDLLAFSRVTTKAQPFKHVDLNQILREVLSDMEVKLEETGAQVNIKRLPPIDADSMQMRQLFQNLISNGLKFSRPGVTPEIQIYSTINKHDTGDEIIIAVADNGIGFDTKYLDRIFTIFQRLHGRGDYEGTGIGLAVVRKIAERHNGSVTAESTLDKGATFLVTLPIQQKHKNV